MTESRQRAESTGGESLQIYRGPGGPVRTDLLFDDLAPADDESPVVTLQCLEGPFPELGPQIHQISQDTEDGIDLRIHESSAGLQWVSEHLGRFWVDTDGQTIRYRLAADSKASDVESLLVGPVLATAAQLRGETLLHASSVLIDGEVIAFAGPQGRGKSTLAAAFASSGHLHFSDDILNTRPGTDGFDAASYLPTVRLWDSSILGLALDRSDNLERVVSWADKRKVQKVAPQAAAPPDWAPLGAIYLLGRADSDTAPSTARLDGTEACLRLQTGMYGAHWMPPGRAVETLGAASDLVDAGLVRELTYNFGYDSLEAIRATVIDDLRGTR